MRRQNISAMADREQGFSLIEVMITLVIIAIGLLGVAGVMALAMSNNGTARMQSLASLEVASLSTAMQSNQAYWVHGAGATATVAVQNTTITPAGYGSAINCSLSTCSAAEVAGYDLATWGQSIAQALPNGVGNVSCTQSAGPGPTPPTETVCTITVQWQETTMSLSHAAGSGASAVTHSYALVVQP